MAAPRERRIGDAESAAHTLTSGKRSMGDGEGAWQISASSSPCGCCTRVSAPRLVRVGHTGAAPPVRFRISQLSTVPKASSPGLGPPRPDDLHIVQEPGELRAREITWGRAAGQ